MSTLKTTETAESKENLNKWKDIPYSQIERLNIIKITNWSMLVSVQYQSKFQQAVYGDWDTDSKISRIIIKL